MDLGSLWHGRLNAWWTHGGNQGRRRWPKAGWLGLQGSVFGWRRGVFVVGVYAPISTARAHVRQECRRQVTQVLAQATGDDFHVIGGDFNAEVGFNGDGR